VLPDGCIDIIYSSTGHLEVVGAMTRARRFDVPAQTQIAGVRFRPGMATPFLHVPAEEITDRTIPLHDLWGSVTRELEGRLAESRPADRGHILAAGLGIPATQPSNTQRAVEAITAAQGNLEVDWVIRQAGITERQFRRRLLEETGLSPKKLCRVLRFRHAYALGRCGLPWSLIAVEAGYFDQPHLIRDFREFAGDTPMSVFSNTSRGHSS
jgi:AraC-like DNA-binding protein